MVDEGGRKGRGKMPKPFRPPPATYDSGAPESSLCYALVDEAIIAGWEYYPEYGGYDILLVAQEGCSTTGVEVGTQVGIQAKMEMNKKLIAQLTTNRVRRKRYRRGPDYIAALVPAAPRTPKEKERAAKLKDDGVGLLYIYDVFNGNDSELTVMANSLTDLSKLGTAAETSNKRVGLPADMPRLELDPGSAGGAAWTRWKHAAMQLVVGAHVRGELTYRDFQRHKLSITVWRNTGWIEFVRKEGRHFVYRLADTQDNKRVDKQYPSIFKKYMEEYVHEEEGEDDKEDGSKGGQHKGFLL